MIVLVACIAQTAYLAASVSAAVPPSCLELTTHAELNTSAIVNGLGLTPDQVRQARARLSQYGSIRGFPGLDGLGLTADQVSQMNARIAAQVAKNAHPLGWPCAPFQNRARTVAFVRALLVGNGFRSYSIKFTTIAARQIQFTGIQDGVALIGAVAKTGPKQLTIELTAPGVGNTSTVATPFLA